MEMARKPKLEFAEESDPAPHDLLANAFVMAGRSPPRRFAGI
jgi:hypothetical protein